MNLHLQHFYYHHTCHVLTFHKTLISSRLKNIRSNPWLELLDKHILWCLTVINAYWLSKWIHSFCTWVFPNEQMHECFLHLTYLFIIYYCFTSLFLYLWYFILVFCINFCTLILLYLLTFFVFSMYYNSTLWLPDIK